MSKNKISLLRCLSFMLVTAALFSFFYFHRYLSFENLRLHRHLLLQWENENYYLSVGLYILLYTLAVSASFPATAFLTLIGGFLFGTFPGSLYAIISATGGSSLLFLMVKVAFSEWFEQKAGARIKAIEAGFKKNTFRYLISLRLIPFLPFWLITISAGLLSLDLVTFASATFLGLIPGIMIYTTMGHHLGMLLESERGPSLSLFLQAHFLWPLLALAGLALLPLVHKGIKSALSTAR